MATMTTREPRRTSRGASSRQVNMNNTRVPPGGSVRRNGSSSLMSQMHPDGIYSNERMVCGLVNMLGYNVTLHVRNGSVYEGVLSTVGPKMEILLSAGTLLRPSANGQSPKPLNREVMNMIFKANDIVCFSAANVDFDASRADSFIDSSITRNGQSTEREMKELEPWEAGTGDDASYTLDPNANGWDASEMFRKNAERFDVKSTYDENLSQYTTPLVRKNDQDYKRKEEEAERIAREIESSETYKARIALENGDRDEESKFSAVLRPGEGGANNRSVPLSRRPQISSNQNMPVHQVSAAAMQPLPRDKRTWENHRSVVSNPSVQQTCVPPAVPTHSHQRRPEINDQRVNGDVTKDRKGEGIHLRAQKAMSVSSTAISPHGPQHHAGTHPVTPQHHTGTHPVTPLQQQSCPPVNTIPQNHIQQQQGPTPLMPPPQSSQPLQSVSTIQQPSQLPVVAAATPSVPIPTPASVLQTSVASVTASLEKPEPCPASPTTQVQAQTSQPAERKSPRDKEKLEGLKDFQRNFKLEDGEDHKAERAQEKKTGLEEKKEEEKVENKLLDKVAHSNLNPNAKEFKPASYGMKPAPSPTPPRQSPVIHPSSVVSMCSPTLFSNVGILATGRQTMAQSKTYPKRAVVSVQPDPMLATGQPLLAQPSPLPTQYLFQAVPLPQGATSTIQVMPSRIAPNSVHMSHQPMDPSQVSGQPTHSAHQIFVAQQAHGPIPAHMGPHHGAQAMSHPQPAHTHMQQHQHQHQHQHQQHHPSSVPPGPQGQSGQMTPHPSASPVQHLGPNGPNPGAPQQHHGHAQGVPPTSGTPQPSLNYGQQIGLQGHPPLQPAHALPAHTHVGLSNSNHQSLHHVPVNYMTHTLQVAEGGFLALPSLAGGGQLPFSQAGPSASGPGPAHVQHNAPMGQYNVVVMPQPPPHTVNQATLSNHHHGHQYQQHHVPAASQLHNTAGQAHALIPGGMSAAIPVSGTGLVGIHHSQLPHFAPPAIYQRMPCPVEVQGKEAGHP
ncbi:ataxin-2-like isoform X2 [Pomacea canaliculata]|nr:ataxin-2-like isoform X2 [Pomacea canaliculata]